MEYTDKLKAFAGKSLNEAEITDTINSARNAAKANATKDVYKLCYSCIDLTSLNSFDSNRQIETFTRKAIDFNEHFADIPNVASICVYPLFVDVVGMVASDSDIAITSVAAGFPSSQTFLEVKMLETAMAVENGADEIDVVINIGQMLSQDYNPMASEIEVLKKEVGEDVILKVIIESGVLETPEIIRNASLLAMMAGADFVKTSTGKMPVAATPEAAVIMCSAIKEYYSATGRKVGFKAAGGVTTATDAVLYYSIVQSILGDQWLTPNLFRIGASSLANNLISAIENREVKYF